MKGSRKSLICSNNFFLRLLKIKRLYKRKGNGSRCSKLSIKSWGGKGFWSKRLMRKLSERSE